jgi:hypothetical protein
MKCEGLEQDGFGAVFPGLLEAVAEASVAVLFDPIERERWASDVATNSLESLSVATINGEPSVDVHAIELSIGTIRIGRDEMERATKLAHALSGTLAEQDEVRGGCTRTRGKHRLFSRKTHLRPRHRASVRKVRGQEGDPEYVSFPS